MHLSLPSLPMPSPTTLRSWLPGTRCRSTRQGSSCASPPPHCPAGFIPSTAGLRGVTAAFTNNVRKHVYCFCVLPLWSCAPFGLSVLPAWLPCQNVLPADLHAIPFARNTQQVLVFAAPVANACCPLLYSCRSITFATVAKPISLSFDGSSVAGARLALAVRFPYIRCTPPRSPRSRPAT